MRDKGIRQLTKYISIESLGDEAISYQAHNFWRILKGVTLFCIIFAIYSNAHLITIHLKNISSKFVIKRVELSDDALHYSELFKGLEGEFLYKAQINAYDSIKRCDSIESASIKVENGTLNINILEKQSAAILAYDDTDLFVDVSGHIIREVVGHNASLKTIQISGSGIVELLPQLIPKLISLNFIEDIYSLRYLGARRMHITTNNNILLKVNLQTLEDVITLFKHKKGFFLRFSVIDFRLFPARLYAK